MTKNCDHARCDTTFCPHCGASPKATGFASLLAYVRKYRHALKRNILPEPDQRNERTRSRMNEVDGWIILLEKALLTEKPRTAGAETPGADHADQPPRNPTGGGSISATPA